MNTIFRILLFSIVISHISVVAQASEKRYGFETAIIQYNISGHIKGEETAYIAGWGAKEARHSTYKLMMEGIKQEQKRMTLREGNVVSNVDLIRRKKIQIDLNKKIAPGLHINLTAAEMSDYSPEGLKRLGAQGQGEESVAGKVCRVYELPFLNGRVWVYKNLALKYVTTVRGFRTEYTATHIEEGVEIPEDRLALPIDVIDMGVLAENNIMGSIQPNSEYKPVKP